MSVRCVDERPSLSAFRISAQLPGHQVPVEQVNAGSEREMSDSRREEAISETRARQTNEWIQESNDKFGAHHPMDEYRCECSDAACEAVISLSRDEYETVREDGLLFFIATDHENPELDRLVVTYERYSIVSKLPGEPARIALEANPRKA